MHGHRHVGRAGRDWHHHHARHHLTRIKRAGHHHHHGHHTPREDVGCGLVGCGLSLSLNLNLWLILWLNLRSGSLSLVLNNHGSLLLVVVMMVLHGCLHSCHSLLGLQCLLRLDGLPGLVVAMSEVAATAHGADLLAIKLVHLGLISGRVGIGQFAVADQLLGRLAEHLQILPPPADLNTELSEANLFGLDDGFDLDYLVVVVVVVVVVAMLGLGPTTLPTTMALFLGMSDAVRGAVGIFEIDDDGIPEVSVVVLVVVVFLPGSGQGLGVLLGGEQGGLALHLH